RRSSDLLVAEHAPTDAKHHRPVSLDERSEGILVACGGEALQQVYVGRRPRAGQPEKLAQAPQGDGQVSRRHDTFSRNGPVSAVIEGGRGRRNGVFRGTGEERFSG